MSINWHTYNVTIRFRDRVVGGIPIIPEGADRADAYLKWNKGQGVEDDPSFEKPLAEALAEDPDMPVTTEQIEGMETGFRRDDEGIYLEARQAKAMLREAAQRLGYIKRTAGTRQVLQHDLHVRALDGSQHLYFKNAAEPSGKDMRPISVVTRQGPRTALKRFEYVTQDELTFQVRILAGGIGEGHINEVRLRDMLDFGGELGLGADRSQGLGQFDVVAFEDAAS